jgi:NTE family protein
MSKIGYVLSGGGARGFAHLGVLKLLEEIKIKPYAISGTSIGAIIGALYADGKNPEQIMHLLKRNDFLSWTNFSWRKDSLFAMDALRKLLQQSILHDDFESLKIKLFINATDLKQGESVVFSTGKLIEPIIASASIPMLFKPVEINNRLLSDGGIMNNFPIEPLLDTCDMVIGSYVNRMHCTSGIGTNHESVNIIDKCFHLAISNSVYSKATSCNTFIESPLYNYSMTDTKHADEIFEIGYNAALEHKTELENSIFPKENNLKYLTL